MILEARRKPAAVAHQLVLAAQFRQRVLDRPQIAGAVIEDRDHSSPLVEGNWFFNRVSREQAYRIALAKHLKMASILWWLERPYITLACRLAPAWVTKPPKKSSTSSRLQVAHQPDPHQVFVDQRRTPAQVHGHHRQGLVHGHHEVAGAVDALAVPQRLGEQLAEHDAGVLHGVMLVHVQIALGAQFQVEAAVFGEQLQHVIEETDAGRDFIGPAPLDAQPSGNARFLGIAADGRVPHDANTSSR